MLEKPLGVITVTQCSCELPSHLRLAVALQGIIVVVASLLIGIVGFPSMTRRHDGVARQLMVPIPPHSKTTGGPDRHLMSLVSVNRHESKYVVCVLTSPYLLHH